MRVSTRSIGFLSVVGGLAIVAASPTPAAGQSQVVVRAVSSDGQPVLDLKSGEVTVRTDGKEREVKSLELVKPGASAAGSGPAKPAAAPLPPPFATNLAAAPSGARGGREILIAIDDEGTGPGREQPVRDAITKLVATLSPADRVGLFTMKQGGLALSPTSDHASVLAALPKVIATGSARESSTDLACRTKVMMTSIAGFLAGAPPERTLVFFSPGLAPSGENVSNRLGSETSVCLIRMGDIEELGRAAASSPAEFIIVHHTEGVANATNRTTSQQGLENIAGSTGAEMIRMSSTPDAAVARISQTAGIYYLATLDEGAPGTARRIEARVSRDNVRVSARPIAAAAAPPTSASKPMTPRDMMRVPDMFRDVAVRAAAIVSRMPVTKEAPANASLKVMVLFQPEDPTTKFSAASVGFYDQKGKLTAQWTAQAKELEGSLVPAALTVAPGTYRMRVAVNDGAGKAGTTDATVSVQLTDAPPVKIGEMMLGTGGQSGFVPRLQFTAADAQAIGLIEVYGVAKDMKVESTFEIVKPDGTALGSGQGTVGNGPGEDVRITYGGFGIETLEPGDYTMKATVLVDGKPAGTVSRTLRKVK